MGVAALGHPCDSSGDHCVPSTDLGIVFDNAAGDSARSGAATRGRAHLRAGNGTDLRTSGELGAHVRNGIHRDWIRIVECARCGLRDRGQPHDGDHRVAAVCGHDRTVALAEAGCRGRHARLSDHRSLVFRRQCIEGVPGWMGNACCRIVAVHVDDDLEEGPSACCGTAHCARNSTG